MTDQMIDVPGGRLRVRDEGHGPPMLLLHAGIARLESWDRVAELLVEAGHRVVRHDLRTWGESTTRTQDFRHHDDAVAVLDAVGIGRAVLVGNSIGGAVVFDAALAHPDRVAAVVGVAAGLNGAEFPGTENEERLFARMSELESSDPRDPDAVADLDVRVWVDGPEQSAGRAPEWVREAVREWDRALNAPGRVLELPGWLEPPVGQRLGELRCPVLAVAGRLDVSEVVATAQHIGEHAPEARVVVWDDVAHMIGMEVPERLAAEMADFAAALPPCA